MQNTFGPVLFDIIDRQIPKERFVVFDTKKEGRRPDTMKMLKDIYVAFGAEGMWQPRSGQRGHRDLIMESRSFLQW